MKELDKDEKSELRFDLHKLKENIIFEQMNNSER
jgi:hypothetical protein